MARTPIAQLVVSETSDRQDFANWLRDREPQQIVMIDESPNAQTCVDMARQQYPDAVVRRLRNNT